MRTDTPGLEVSKNINSKTRARGTNFQFPMNAVASSRVPRVPAGRDFAVSNSNPLLTRCLCLKPSLCTERPRNRTRRRFQLSGQFSLCKKPPRCAKPMPTNRRHWLNRPTSERERCEGHCILLCTSALWSRGENCRGYDGPSHMGDRAVKGYFDQRCMDDMARKRSFYECLE